MIVFTRASRLYQPGTEVFNVNQLPVGVTAFMVSFSRENWPGIPSDDVMIVSLAWSTGEGVTATFPGGTVLGKDGQPLLFSTLTIRVPQVSDGSGGKKAKNVVTAQATVQVVQALNTAITIEAV